MDDYVRPGRRWPGWICVGALALAAGATGLVFTRHWFDSYDASIMVRVTESMLHQHDFLVPRSADPFHANSPYASYGLGMSLLYAPFYFAAEHLHRDPIEWAMSANAFVFAAITATIFWLARNLGATLRQAVVTALLTAFGTLLLPYAATGFSEPSVALGIALGLAGMTLVPRRLVAGSLLAGAAAGLALLMRTDSLVLVVPLLALGVWLMARCRWRCVAPFAIGVLPFVAVWAWYNAVRFGAPWHLGYAGQSFSHAWLPGFVGLLVSPGAGLLWYVPLVPVGIAGGLLAVRRMPVLIGIAAALVAVRIVVYAAWFDWSGMVAWGPRFLTPAMPVLALGILEVLRRFDGLPLTARLAVPAIAAVSLGVQAVGVTVRPEANHMIQALRLVTTKTPATQMGCVSGYRRPTQDDVIFDWRCFPITDEAKQLLSQQALFNGRYFGPPMRPKHLGLLGLLALLGFDVAVVASRRRTHIP